MPSAPGSRDRHGQRRPERAHSPTFDTNGETRTSTVESRVFMTSPTAVVLLNLGGPDSLKAVRPFLYNLFSDPDIFQFPLGRFAQKIFARLISWRRAHEATRGYAAIGGKSPILEHTQEQAIALQLALAGAADVYVCMRYWHPLTAEVVAELKGKGYKKVVLLPLYPQYSRTTTGSSYNEFVRQSRRLDYDAQITLISHWYDQPTYIDAIVDTLRTELRRFPYSNPTHVELLLSAHGLPRRLSDQGDPYEQQIKTTCELVQQRLNWPNVTLCYQSRVGPLEWLQPYTEQVIREKGAKGAKQMLVYPIAFVSDHIETLYELGITYAELARMNGIEHYRVAPALNTHPLLIETLRDQVVKTL
jgi:protoporphyrin/coproporphyrin ferrochelatase